jgi:iron complex transport system substrate-binding protein
VTRALALLVGLALAASAGAAVRAVDDTGKTIVLASPARRIVTLAPHAAELVSASGAGSAIVGSVGGSRHPELRDVAMLGDAHAVDLERIVALRPDLVVTWPYTSAAPLDRLRARGIPVFVTDPATPDAIASVIERVGTLAGTSAAAHQAAIAFRERLRVATMRAGGARVVRVFYEIWHEPMYTIGGRHLISQAIALCGGENVFASSSLPAPQVSVEAVLAARPDAIVAGTDGAVRPDWLDAWKRWPELPAVRNGALFVVDGDLLHRAGPRFAEGVSSLCAALERARVRR